MPSPTDFNLSPYYDDFNESKKFHRVLFDNMNPKNNKKGIF